MAEDTNRQLEERAARAADLVKSLMERLGSYHDHKESMAYAGITLHGAVAVAVLVSDQWPPACWSWHPLMVASLALTAVWCAVLSYLHFQLHMRRNAAMRITGCELFLAACLQRTLTTGDLDLPAPRKRDGSSKFAKFADWFWPLQRTEQAVDTARATYPRFLVEQWLEAERRPTDALKHGRLIMISGWLLYLAALARPWL